MSDAEHKRAEQLKLLAEAVGKKEEAFQEWVKKLMETLEVNPEDLPEYEGSLTEIVLAPNPAYTRSVKIKDDLVLNLSKQTGMPSKLGEVDILRCIQLSKNVQEVVSLALYYRPGSQFADLVACNAQWSSFTQNIIYEDVGFERGRVARFVKATLSGGLFPITTSRPLLIQPGQRLEVDFRRGESGIEGWKAKLSFDRFADEANFRDGRVIGNLNDVLASPFPKVFDPTPHVQSIFTRDGKFPFLS